MLYWAVLTLGPPCRGVSLGFSSYLISLSTVTDATASIGGQEMLLALSSFMLEVVALTLLYVAVPNCQIKYRWGIIGGIVVATIFELTKKLFSIYITNFTSYEVLYGAMATIPIVLLWIYLTWVIILFGAVLVYALSNKGHYIRGGRHPFVLAYICLGNIHQAHSKGESISLSNLQKILPQESSSEIEYVLTNLLTVGLLYKVESGDYILGKDLTSFSLKDLYDVLPWKLPIVGIDNYTALSSSLQSASSSLTECLNTSLVDLYAKDFG